MPEMTWTVPFLPNAAHGPPHVGHLWTLVHARYVYNELTWRSELDALGRDWYGDIAMKWAVLWDINCEMQHMVSFGRMTDWLGWEWDIEDHMVEWVRFCGRHERLSGMGVLNHMFQLPRYSTGVDHNAHTVKMLWMNAHNVWWLNRGMDLVGLEVIERDLMQFVPLRRPVVLYHPLLLDNDGAKIGGANVPQEYLIDDELMGMDADAVFAGLCRACGFSDGWDENCVGHADRNHQRLEPVVRHIEQFHCFNLGPSWVAHIAVNKNIRVPLDWRSHIER